MKKLIITSFLLYLGLAFSSCSNRVYFEKAESQYKNMAFSRAASNYEKIAEKKEYPQAKKMLAECYGQMNQTLKQEYWLRKVVESGESTTADLLVFAPQTLSDLAK